MNRIAMAGLVSLVFTGVALGDIRVHGVPVARWGLMGEQVGVGGATIESFEDANLVPGLQVRVTTNNGSYGPTSTLPSVFNTSVDPFGTAFNNMQWDGVAGLINTSTNQAKVYADANNWGDVEFIFATTVRLVAFSVAQREVGALLIVNGVTLGELGSLSGIGTSGGHGGYIMIDATGTDTITSVKVDNSNGGSGDGIVFDYLAFTSEPLPQISVTGFAANFWGASKATLGIRGAAIEDFEDATLIPRLQVEWDAPAGRVGPTATLPNLFNPVNDDPFGNAFDLGVWDGARTLVTGQANKTWAYSDGTHWGDIVMRFSPAMYSVGFSLEDYEGPCRVIVNGRDIGSLQQLSGLPFVSQGRNGFVRFDGPDAAVITSLRLANNRAGGGGDGYAIDHLAIRGCGADVNQDGFVNGDDYDAFAEAFEAGDLGADFNEDGFVNGDDYDLFAEAFEAGC